MVRRALVKPQRPGRATVLQVASRMNLCLTWGCHWYLRDPCLWPRRPHSVGVSASWVHIAVPHRPTASCWFPASRTTPGSEEADGTSPGEAPGGARGA